MTRRNSWTSPNAHMSMRPPGLQVSRSIVSIVMEQRNYSLNGMSSTIGTSVAAGGAEQKCDIRSMSTLVGLLDHTSLLTLLIHFKDFISLRSGLSSQAFQCLSLSSVAASFAGSTYPDLDIRSSDDGNMSGSAAKNFILLHVESSTRSKPVRIRRDLLKVKLPTNLWLKGC
jgi:hypothetical protein